MSLFLNEDDCFMLNNIKPDIVLILNKNDIQLYIILTTNKVIILLYKLQYN